MTRDLMSRRMLLEHRLCLRAHRQRLRTPREVRATTNPLGLRGLGEVGNPGLGGAIANAVCDALASGDLAITALPLTPARVFHAAGPTLAHVLRAARTSR